MKRLLFIPVLVAGVLLSACGSHYDAANVDHFTELKNYHMRFIDRYVAKGERVYDADGVRDGYDQVTREFDKAQTYMQNKDDKDGLKALAYFRAELDKDYRFLNDTEKLFSPEYATQRKTALATDYDLAVKGDYGDVGDHD
jgi:hypothetical protein